MTARRTSVTSLLDQLLTVDKRHSVARPGVVRARISEVPHFDCSRGGSVKWSPA
jgi:hypothetical protein